VASVGLDGLALGLDLGLARLRRPWEVQDGNDEEGVAMNLSANLLPQWKEGQSSIPIISNTGKGVVPGHESSEETKVATGLDDARLGGASGGLEVTDREQKEGHIQEEKQQEESQGRAQGAQHHHGSEDEPASEEVAKGVVEVIGTRCCGRVGINNVEERSQDNSEGNPETTI
jgi:hypothetical protein